MTLTLRSAAAAAARATSRNNATGNARMTILLFTRKGLRWTDCAGLLALRVRMACTIRFGPRPSRDRPQWPEAFPRLQLRGSAGFTPASQSSPSGKDAPSEGYEKEQKKLYEEFTEGRVWKSNGQAVGQWICLDPNEQDPRWRHPERSRPSGGVRDLPLIGPCVRDQTSRIEFEGEDFPTALHLNRSACNKGTPPYRPWSRSPQRIRLRGRAQPAGRSDSVRALHQPRHAERG